MPSTVRQQIDDVQRKSVGMRLRPSGETLHKRVVDPNVGRALGRVLARAIELGGLTKQAIAIELGYSDQSAVSRWIAGIENPPLARLLIVAGFRVGLLLALAEDTDSGVVVEQVVRIQRRRA